MTDFTSMQEIYIFAILGPLGKPEEYPFHPTDFHKLWGASREIGAEINIFSDKRLVDTFGPEAQSPDGGDIAFRFWELN